MKYNKEEFIWAEKYRPQTLEDLIFPEDKKEKIREWINQKEIPNLGLFGSIPGTGKSSMLNVLIKELETDTLWINGSKETGVDTFRMKVSKFASSVALAGRIKLIVVDESDYLSQNAQALLRSDLEQLSSNARFVFTGNYPERILTPLLNRLQVFDLDKIYQTDKKELVSQILKRMKFILSNEKIEYNSKDLVEVIKAYYPSSREMIMYLQQNSTNGKFKFDGISKTDEIFASILDNTKNRKFKVLKSLTNDLINPESFYTYLWKTMDTFIKPESQPNVILWLAEYQDYSARAKNKQIPLMAFLVKVISDPSIKFV